MLDVVTRYSRQWRFRVNPKKGKSEVMVFGRRKRQKETRKWMLGGKQIFETDQYKYLGVDLGKGLHFKVLKDRLVKNAKKRMMLVWAMGMRTGDLPVEDLMSSVEGVGETSTRVRSSSVGRSQVGRGGEGAERNGEDDFEMQPEHGE